MTHTNTNTEQERAEFEKRFKYLDLTQEPDAWGVPRYKHAAISLAWEAWQAARSAQVVAQGFRDGAASLSANAGEPRNAIDRDALIDAIAQCLHGTWYCTRVWEAWHVGTMSKNDFEPVDESETPIEIADAVLALLAAQPAAPAQPDAAQPNSLESGRIKTEAAPVHPVEGVPAQAAPQASEPYAVLVFERGEEGPFDRKPVKPNSMSHLHAKRDPHYDYIELYTHPIQQGLDAAVRELIDRLQDAQQDINLAANTHMSQQLASAAALLDEVESTLRALAATQPAAQGVELANCKGGKWLTVVYHDIQPGDESRTIVEHPKVSALSWSHALHDRDAAIAAQAKQG